MTADYVPSQFENRWLITGRLTTVSPLHIGAGIEVDRAGLADPPSAIVKVKAVFRDSRGYPCLPGSSIKGILRARMASRLGADHPAVFALFGKPEGHATDAGRDPGHAGTVDFLDASAAMQGLPPNSTPPPFWRKFDEDPVPGLLTGITANVAIRRRTRTAAHRKLFHTEFVPPDIKFDVSLIAYNASDEHIARLLGVLDQFNLPDEPLQLGAKTGNGWGRFKWEREAVRKMVPAEVCRWLAEQPLPPAHQALASLPPYSLAATTLPASQKNALCLRITLHFDGPFLVKRPMSPKPRGSEAPNALPYLDETGRVVLPGASFRGVLRSQAERILRTLAPDPGTAARWAPDPSSERIEEVREGNIEALSPIARVFGATGWRSPIEVSAFNDRQAQAARTVTHELVAIDRFTGGAAPGAKFKFEVMWSPVLSGTLKFNCSRWRFAKVDGWAAGLCALVLRDLQQGDLSFGMGAGKGYGRCVRAEFAWFSSAVADVASFHRALQKGLANS